MRSPFGGGDFIRRHMLNGLDAHFFRGGQAIAGGQRAALDWRHTLPADSSWWFVLDRFFSRDPNLGAAYITLVCLLPEALMAKIGGSLYFGGTSILIVVTVTMDTVAQIQSYLLAHQYEGLIKKSKLRERRR